jgi:hypothetical protein
LTKASKILTERVTLWHNDYEGPRKTALWTHNYKLFLNEKEAPCEMFDMLSDPREANNLLHNISQAAFAEFMNLAVESNFAKGASKLTNNKFALPVLTEDVLLNDRGSYRVHVAILVHLFKTMYEFAKHGDEAYQIYFKRNLG